MSGFFSNTLGLNREADEFLSMGFESSTTTNVNCGGIGGEIVVTEGFLFGEEEEEEGRWGLYLSWRVIWENWERVKLEGNRG
ncbi:hypothetical protein V6N13_009879 [Hibiscus sabdariffa]|uniref:Uncharacterized protein n=2 Tax=Hibiscus sabdariffa TaxID=183260 RepID=A0ABR1ZN74_9ROSI